MQGEDKLMTFTFQEWLAELRLISKTVQQYFYDGDEGDDCWRDSFDDGLTPMEALLEDASHAG